MRLTPIVIIASFAVFLAPSQASADVTWYTTDRGAHPCDTALNGPLDVQKAFNGVGNMVYNTTQFDLDGSVVSITLVFPNDPNHADNWVFFPSLELCEAAQPK